MSSIFDNNSRRFKKFPQEVESKFRKLDLGQAQKEMRALSLLIEKAENLSELGVFVATNASIEYGTLIEVSFFFQVQEREVKALARVMHPSLEQDGEKGMGIELLKVNPELFAKIVSRAKRGDWVEAEKS